MEILKKIEFYGHAAYKDGKEEFIRVFFSSLKEQELWEKNFYDSCEYNKKGLVEFFWFDFDEDEEE